MHTILDYQQYFLEHLSKKVIEKEPKNLYEPISYILNLGGKRLRPTLVLITAEIFGSIYEEALEAALAIEIFHNFSLVHDDIMDEAPLRRGKETVHVKWDINTGILSGDAMLIMAYQLFEKYEGETFRALAKLFSKTAIEVCEGQQYDIDFETRDDVTIPEYLKMIEYKTAVLVGAAMEMGAIIAKASDQSKSSIYAFGKLLGVAFQLQDDYLDVFGDPESFGKQVGGDIIENKKTFLYLKALQLGTSEEKKRLIQLFSENPEDSSKKVDEVTNIFETTGARMETRLEVEKYTKEAFEILNELPISKDKKEMLHQFGEQLMSRSF